MPRWNPAGLHCYVTGGSQGLGLELALLLVKERAHVSIVARDQSKLDAAIRQLEDVRVDESQIIRAYSFSLNTAEGAEAALTAASVPHEGRVPDALFLCAGSARPGFFVEETPAGLQSAFDNVYWVQAWSALTAAKTYAKQRAKGKIVFVSSTVGLMGLIGYSSYAPAKHALRGLADTLRSELSLYGVDVQIFFPPTMQSPGYENENKTKPKITLKIEEDDKGLSCAVAARGMLEGVKQGQAHITADFINTLLRATMRGAAPYNNIVLDTIYACIGNIALPDWRRGVDKLIVKHRKEHEEYLQQKGFWND
ncbi:NAD(P)-binding protein [Exidia glandulosa HHB12029]|uniref:3-dehydrosphinganine reductase n=1 Tax=Exidia glandulosa HHB12029 TaxID=1314781 RepID=A0A165PB35_EXIGL|nr:NAD(P)-binding protein [Exidia glandulosa HHB12029]